MERDTDVALFVVVSRSKFKSLLMSRKYERRNRGVLICLEKLPDGRESFAILDSEWAIWEKVECEVLSEIQRVSDDNALVEIIDPVVAPQPPVANIPPGDLEAANRSGILGGPLPIRPESSRPRDHRGGTIDFGPLF